MNLRHGLYRSVSRLRRGLRGGGPVSGQRILLYHSVGTRLPDDPYGTGMGLDDFRSHLSRLDELRGRWTPAPFSRPRPSAAELAVTFDDGYRDVLVAASPLLIERGQPFTVFVTADFIRGGSPLYLDPAALKQLSALPGASIGSHGVSHRPLTALSNDDLREELRGSRKYLEDLLGRPVTALSYPHGSVDRRVRDAAEEAGYSLGGTSRYGLNGPGRDPLLLCRTELTAWDTADDLELKVLGHWDWYRLRHRDPASDSAP